MDQRYSVNNSLSASRRDHYEAGGEGDLEAFLGRCGRHPSPDLGSDSAQGAAARLGCLGEGTQEELEVGQQQCPQPSKGSGHHQAAREGSG